MRFGEVDSLTSMHASYNKSGWGVIGKHKMNNKVDKYTIKGTLLYIKMSV